MPEERGLVGLTWAAENNYQYDLVEPDKALSVIPRGGCVELLVNIVDHPIELGGERRGRGDERDDGDHR